MQGANLGCGCMIAIIVFLSIFLLGGMLMHK